MSTHQWAVVLVVGLLGTGPASAQNPIKASTVETRTPEDRQSTMKKPLSMSDLLARYDRLPDLTAMARDIGGIDIYAVRDRLAREHDAQKKPYRLATPYRNPGSPCKSGEHHVASIQYTLVNPARHEKAELWQAELHEAQAHGAVLPSKVIEFLERLVDADVSVPAARGRVD